MDQPAPILPVVDPSDLINVLIDIQVGIRKISLYTFSHPVVPNLVSNLTNQLNALLETADVIHFGIGKDEIMYQGYTLSTNNPVISELSRLLHQLNLISVTFRNEASEEDILKLLKFIVDNRASRFKQGDPIVTKFHEEVDSISLQLVSFKDAVSDQNVEDPGAELSNQDSGDIWHGLVNRLMEDELPEEVKLELKPGSSDSLNPDRMANIINGLFTDEQTTKKNYVNAIVEYLQEQAKRQKNQDQKSPQNHRELNALFSNLRSDVREQIYRFSMEENDDQNMPLEDLLEIMPTKHLSEVLNQIQLTEREVSTPMFSLLKKMVTISDSDNQIRHLLESKVEDHKSLFDELFIYRAEREYYPASYREMLDKNLSQERVFPENSPNPQDKSVAESETDRHLALILLEILDGPIISEKETEGSVNYLRDLLVQGLGDYTLPILMNAIQILCKNCSVDSETDRAFWGRVLKNFFMPEVVVQIVQACQSQEEGEDRIVNDLVTLAGSDFFPVLLNILEDETNLSARKQIIQFMVQCGPLVIPFAVERLSSDKWYVVRNMLVILRDLKADDAIPHISRCMKHESEKVRLAALQALGSVRNETKMYIECLEIAIRDVDEKISKMGMTMLVSCHRPDAMDLVTRLFDKSKKDEDLTDNQLDILKAIGRSGLSTWLPMLLKIRKRSISWFWCWGQKRLIQKEIRKAISSIEARVRTEHAE